jgi:hypothetical protein
MTSSLITVTRDSKYCCMGSTFGHHVCCVQFRNNFYFQLKNRQTMPVFKSVAYSTMSINNPFTISSKYDLSQTCTAMATMTLPVFTLQPAKRQMLMLETSEESLCNAVFSILYKAFNYNYPVTTSLDNLSPTCTVMPAMNSPVHLLPPAERQISILKTAEVTIADSVLVFDVDAQRYVLPIIWQKVYFKSMYHAFCVCCFLVCISSWTKIAQRWMWNSCLQFNLIKYVQILHLMVFIVRLKSALNTRCHINSCRLRLVQSFGSLFSTFFATLSLKLKIMQTWMSRAALVFVIFTAPFGVQGIPCVRISQKI